MHETQCAAMDTWSSACLLRDGLGQHAEKQPTIGQRELTRDFQRLELENVVIASLPHQRVERRWRTSCGAANGRSMAQEISKAATTLSD